MLYSIFAPSEIIINATKNDTTEHGLLFICNTQETKHEIAIIFVLGNLAE